MARFTNDMEMLGTGIKTLFGKVVAEPLRALGCVVVACWISWQLTLMFLVLVPIAAVHPHQGRPDDEAGHAPAAGTHVEHLQDPARDLPGIRVVKAFTMEPYERRRFRTATKDYYHKAMLGGEPRRPGRPGDRAAGRGGRGRGPAGRGLPGPEPADATVRHPDDRSAAGGRVAASALRPAGGHCRPGAQAVERLHPHPVRRGGRRPHFHLLDRQPRVRANSGSPAAAPASPEHHRVPRRLLLLRAGPADPDQRPPQLSATAKPSPWSARTAAARPRWSA